MDIVSEKLQSILNNIDGGQVGAFSGYDGLVIGKYQSTSSETIDTDLLCAEMASVMKILRSISTGPKDVIITLEDSTVLIKPVDDGFVVISISNEGNLGRARLECNRIGKEFLD